MELSETDERVKCCWWSIAIDKFTIWYLLKRLTLPPLKFGLFEMFILRWRRKKCQLTISRESNLEIDTNAKSDWHTQPRTCPKKKNALSSVRMVNL